MGKRILIIQGHPGRDDSHFCHGLAQAYQAAAIEAGHEVDHVEIARLDFPLLRNEREWQEEGVAPDILAAQQKIRTAEHLVILFPLWMGTMPALLKGFLEQVLRPGFAFDQQAREGLGGRLLKGRSARVIITMGMPGPVYRWFFGAHGYRNLKRNILKFCGIAPVRHCFVGLAGAKDDAGRRKWLERVRKLAQQGR